MRTLNPIPRRLTGLVLAAAFLAAGCGDSTEPTSDAPQLPPAQSMQLDLSFFDGGNANPSVLPTAGTKLNFLNAAVRAAFVNVTVLTIMTPPSLAFQAAIHTVPSRQEDGSWIWIYTWVDRGEDHQVRLTGAPDGDWIDWTLSVALPGMADPEIWFTGRSRVGRDEGWWLFRDFNRTGDPDVLRIDWVVNGINDASLQFTNVLAGSDEEGDELAYTADGADRSIVFDDASATESWEILWNASIGTGSLLFPDYNDGNRACWDENQEDIDCGGPES